MEIEHGKAFAEATHRTGTVEVDGLRIAACVGYPPGLDTAEGQPGCGSPFVREFGACGFVHWRLCPKYAGCGSLTTKNAQRAAAKLERAIHRFVAKRGAAA